MRSKVLSFLLSFSLIFCVGFGSSCLTASAYTGDGVTTFPLAWYNSSPSLYLSNGSSFTGEIRPTYNAIQFYNSSTTTSFLKVGHPNNCISFNFAPTLYDYFILLTASSYDASSSDFVFVPTNATVSCFDCTSSSYVSVACSDFNFFHHDGSTSTGFSVTFRLPDDLDYTSINYLTLSSTSALKIPANVLFMGLIFQMPKGTTSDDFSAIVSAIQNQTSELGGKLDEIQNAIEDQYGGDPGSSFPIEDIITQHNEKMGVLSFGSDTLMQVLGLLSPDQSLSSELVFPSMSLTIAGQRNKVQLWPEYRFDLNELKQHWPDFIGLMQSLTTALVWIFVLRYCYRVFEKYFLAGGGN